MEGAFREIHDSTSSLVNAAPANRGHIIATTTTTDSAASTVQRAAAPEKSKKRPASRIKSTYPRKRALQACQKCRVRRTKCNNARPTCSSCQELNVQCIYSQEDPSSFDAASLAILERLSTIEALLRHSNGSPHDSISAPVDLEDVETSPSQLLKSINSPTLERARDPAPTHMNIEAVLSWPIFDDQVANLDLKGLLNGDSHNNVSQTFSMVPDLDHGAEDELLRLFIESVFIFNPVLREEQIHKYMQDARFSGLGWDAQSCLLVGLADIKRNRHPDSMMFRETPRFQQAESYFSAAQKRLGLLLCKTGVLEAQCFFLAGVYLMATMRPVEAWKMFVQALACCQAFYSTKASAGNQDEGQQRLRETIYWTCFKSELELRLELNVSDTSVWDLTYPAFFPSPPDGLKSQREIVWYFYLAEIALRRLGNRVLNFIYGHQQAPSAASVTDTTLGFEQQALDWVQSLPAPLNLQVGEHDTGLPRTLKFILNGHLLDCYEMMYWPFITQAINGNSNNPIPRYHNNIIAVTSGAASNNDTFARKALQICVERIQKNEQGFYFRHHGTWLMLRSCTRSALVLLAARKSGRFAGQMPSGWREAIIKVMDMLNFWRRESGDVQDRLELIQHLLHSLPQE